MSEPSAAPAEHGDRAAFLGRIRARQGPPSPDVPHPPPPPPEVVPVVGYRTLDGLEPSDPDGLLPVFVAAVRAAEASIDVVDGQIPAELVRSLVERHGVTSAVTSREPEAVAAGALLTEAGVATSPYDRVTAAGADLAVTSATHAVAATGTLVVDSASAGSRAVSLLPRVHLCVVPLDRLVANHSDVLRAQDRPMPSARVLITGPSRTGDIEQLLTLGAHGPVALHIIVTR